MKWLQRKKIRPIYAVAGDSVILSYNDKKIMTKKITESVKVNTVGIFEFNNEFDMKRGFGGVFGEDK